MAAATPAPITFVLSGTTQAQERAAAVRGAAAPAVPAGLPRGQIKQSVRVGAQRGGASDIRMTAVSGEDVVVLHIVGGPLWCCTRKAPVTCCSRKAVTHRSRDRDGMREAAR